MYDGCRSASIPTEMTRETVGKQIYLNNTIIELLHKLPVFNMFSKDELRGMLRSGNVLRLERHPKDTVVIQEGAFSRWAYILLRGAVKVIKEGAEVCQLCERGEIIGEIGAVHSQMRSATVLAMEECMFIAVNIGAIEKMHGPESLEYLQRIHQSFTPLIEERLNKTLEVADIMNQVRQKRQELQELEKRLRQLGAHEEKSMLQKLLDGDGF
jgi:CRP-like cAMP-binding protein